MTPAEGVLAAVAGVPPEYAEVRKALPLFEASGLTREKAEHFVTRLKAAVERSDRDAVANLVSYPLTFRGSQIPDRQSFLRDYDAVINEGVRTAIMEQRAEDLRASGRGVMLGSGELWFRCPDRLLTRSETGSVICDRPNIRIVAIDGN